jgi:hypothetical protein
LACLYIYVSYCFSWHFRGILVGMSNKHPSSPRSGLLRVFGLAEWTAWLDTAARGMFGMSGAEFERSYDDGIISESGEAKDIASMLPLIRRLRDRNKLDKVG